MAMWSSFLNGTEGYNSFSEMTGMELIKLCGNMLFGAGCGVILAFLDQTLQKISGQKPADAGSAATVKPTTETQVTQPNQPQAQ
jgi:hypothetical protein